MLINIGYYVRNNSYSTAKGFDTMKQWKQFITFILVMAMLLTLTPIGVFAAGHYTYSSNGFSVSYSGGIDAKFLPKDRELDLIVDMLTSSVSLEGASKIESITIDSGTYNLHPLFFHWIDNPTFPITINGGEVKFDVRGFAGTLFVNGGEV